jgi:hypothetical protein
VGTAGVEEHPARVLQQLDPEAFIGDLDLDLLGQAVERDRLTEALSASAFSRFFRRLMSSGRTGCGMGDWAPSPGMIELPNSLARPSGS